MKEIGEIFKDTREKIGISIDEVCNDLEVTPAQIDNLEAGNINAFKDVFFLKNLIGSYAKYLNLNQEEIIEAYDSFMFDYTSKIPIEDILCKTRELELQSKDVKKVISPYTKKPKESNKGRIITIAVIIIVSLLILGGIMISMLSDGEVVNNKISYIN